MRIGKDMEKFIEVLKNIVAQNLNYYFRGISKEPCTVYFSFIYKRQVPESFFFRGPNVLLKLKGLKYVMLRFIISTIRL